MKTTSLTLVLAALGTTLQAQPTGAPPPLTLPLRTNRLAAPPSMGTNFPLRTPRTNLVAGATNTPSFTNTLGATPSTARGNLTTNVTAGAGTIRTNVTVSGATIPPPAVAPSAVPTIVPAAPPAIPPGTPAFGAAGAATPTPLPGAAGPGAAAGNTNDDVVFPPGLIKFQDADLMNVLDVYQDLTGRTVMRPSSLPAAKISIKTATALTRKEAIDALNTILAMNQITMINQGDKFVKAVPQAQAFQEADPFNELPGNELNETTHYITQIVQLKNALPREVAPALAPLAKLPGQGIMAIDSSGILVIRDYEENVKRMLELLEKIDVVPQQEFEPIVIPIKYALAADIAQVLGSLTAGGGGGITVGQQQTRTGLSTGGGAGGFSGGGMGGVGGVGGLGGIGGYGGQGGYNPANPLGGAGGAGGSRGFGSQAAGRSSFADRLRSIVNRSAGGAGGGGDIVVLGNTKIIADERTNSLLIFAAKEDIKTIKDIIAKLDVVLPQVLIEAIIMEVALDDTLKYGISYLQRPQTSGKLTGAGGINNNQQFRLDSITQLGTNATASIPSGFSYFGRWGNDLDVAVEALATDNRVNVLSRPHIQTSHAVEANLFVGETRPYITGTYQYYGGGPSSQYSQLQIGITLSVLPLINPDGLVVMDIRQKIQSIGQNVIIDGNPIPATIDREANAKVSVRDKETIILGGFISTERRSEHSGVPLLKDIPILGNLFRSTGKNNNRRELMVLIRPTVLPTPEIAASVARETKSNMPGITAAEKDAIDAERKRLEKVRKDVSKDIMKREGFAEPESKK